MLLYRVHISIMPSGEFIFFCWDSYQDLEMVLFISSSPSSYICFMSFIKPWPGSSLSSPSRLGGLRLCRKRKHAHKTVGAFLAERDSGAWTNSFVPCRKVVLFSVTEGKLCSLLEYSCFEWSNLIGQLEGSMRARVLHMPLGARATTCSARHFLVTVEMNFELWEF